MDPGWDDPTDRRRSYSVEVAGVGGPRNRPGRTAVAALVVVIALVAGGVVSGQLFPVQRSAVAPSASPAALESASTTPAPSPAPTAVPVPTGPLTARVTASAVDVVALVASIPKHGTGPIAFVAGHLHSRPKPCDVGSPLSECLTLSIDGLRGATVVPDDTMLGWPGDPVGGDTLVLLPRDGKLVFVGSIRVDPAGIPRIDVLGARVAAAANHPQVALLETDGVLVQGAAPCLALVKCDLGAPTLFAQPPGGGWQMDFTGAVAVHLASGVFGVSSSAVWTTGPFLVRYTPSDPNLPWQMVAREDQGSILHVVIP